MEYTFAMIKPDAVRAKNSGKIIDLIEAKGFDITRMHKVQLTQEAAKAFYDVHHEKPFFQELVTFITSGPVIIMALAKDHAIKDWRDLMGATDSKKAAHGTIRSLFGTDISHNAVHGSDSADTAQLELSLFFVDEMDEDDMDECDEDDNCDEDDQ
jgi:nucleoside-diphosphate kinase